MRRNLMTSLLVVGGLLLAAMQMGRMRTRQTGWSRITSWMSQMLNQVTSGTNQVMSGSTGMMRAVRRRVRG